MGEYAEAMLDGTVCECCGVYLEGEAEGIPRYCSKACARDRGALESHPNQIYKTPAPKVSCPTCKRRVKPTGLKDHIRDAHGVGK